MPDETPPARHFDNVLLMQYIGAITLLGMVAEKLPKGSEFNFGVDKAMRDANNLLLVAGSTIVFAKTSRGGFGPFEREQFESIKEMVRVEMISRLEAHDVDFLTEEELKDMSGLYRGQLMFGQATKYTDHGQPLWSKADLLARWKKGSK